jgi:carboxylate-amine ligase
MRTVGVEEELLLVDGSTGQPLAVAAAVLRLADAADKASAAAAAIAGVAAARADAGADADPPAVAGAGGPAGPERPGGRMEHELQQQQLEIDTTPQTDLTRLGDELRAWRGRADRAAAAAGARVAALATSPLPVVPQRTASERYRTMAERFGLTAAEQLTCGCHVHVAVQSPEEGVAVLDRIRVWSPVLTALSANSPFWQGTDSGYASFRSQAWQRWPTAGPIEVLGSLERYRALVDALLASGVALDEGMVYFDARLSARYPTLEVRVADVCLRAEDAVLMAALVRGLVDTAADEWRRGVPAPAVPAALVRLATWRAGRSGLADVLLHPSDLRPRAAHQVVDDLVEHVRPALEAAGDLGLVKTLIADLVDRGTGAARQRQVLARTGRLAEVVLDAVDVTGA